MWDGRKLFQLCISSKRYRGQKFVFNLISKHMFHHVKWRTGADQWHSHTRSCMGTPILVHTQNCIHASSEGNYRIMLHHIWISSVGPCERVSVCLWTVIFKSTTWVYMYDINYAKSKTMGHCNVYWVLLVCGYSLACTQEGGATGLNKAGVERILMKQKLRQPQRDKEKEFDSYVLNDE